MARFANKMAAIANDPAQQPAICDDETKSLITY
jgi:hypothetical protein